jgi:Flp pilus assembly protein TadB
MKVESRTCLGAFLFLFLLAGLYWGLVAVHGHQAERAGITLLFFAFSAYLLLGGYLLPQYLRRHGIPRPEDRFDATQEDGAGVIDYFPAASIWPAGMGVAFTFGAMALVWGIWYLYIAGILFVGSMIGWVVESDYTEDVQPGTDPAELTHHHDATS